MVFFVAHLIPFKKLLKPTKKFDVITNKAMNKEMRNANLCDQRFKKWFRTERLTQIYEGAYYGPNVILSALRILRTVIAMC